MEIHKKSSTRLFAQLSEQELSRYRLTFETLCPDGERTKTVLCDIWRMPKIRLAGQCRRKAVFSWMCCLRKTAAVFFCLRQP